MADRKRNQTHTYRVGMLSDCKTVEAPSALAAAALYGIHTRGHAGTMAEVFEEDGHPWRGESIWRRWALGEEPTNEQLELLKNQLPFCRFIKTVALSAAA